MDARTSRQRGKAGASSALGRWCAFVLVLALLGVLATVAANGAILVVQPELKTVAISADLDDDGLDESLYVADGILKIGGAGEQFYRSPRDWIVTDAAVYDFDEDGADEIALVVWGRGSFGTSQPFWVERDTDDFTQHVYVMRYEQGELVPVWMSSALGAEAFDVSFGDDGKVRMVDADGYESVWKWETWGFKLEGEGAASAASNTSATHDAASVSAVSATSATPDAPAASDPSDGTVSFIAVGDNIMHASIFENVYDADTHRYDFSPLYEQVAARISSYDLAAVCQETPLVHDRSLIGDYPDFGTPEEVGDALATAGFDIVAAATNHACDRGASGVESTLAFWETRHPDIALLGLHSVPEQANGPAFVEARGMRFALFDATYGLNGHQLPTGQEWLIDTLDDLDQLVANVGRAEGQADLTICFLHIGEEYADAPTDEQRAVVERLVDAGADVVICSHPHVVQPAERLVTGAGAEAVVFWSLGNFVSNQTDMRTVLGGAAELTFARDENGRATVASFELVPTVCHFQLDEDGKGLTCAYFLSDYTDDLARAHYLNIADLVKQNARDFVSL